MDERTLLIQQLDRAREKIRAVAAAVDPHEEIYPGWTIKEVLAHLSGWDDATIASLRAHAAGDVPVVSAPRGIDEYNAETVTTRGTLDYAHIVKEWEATRDALKAVIREMPVEKFAEPLVFPWGPTGTIARLLAIFCEHEEEHAEEIRKLRMGAMEAQKEIER